MLKIDVFPHILPRPFYDRLLEVAPAGNQGSGVLSSMVEANGLIVLHHAQGSVPAAGEVDVLMFDGVL